MITLALVLSVAATAVCIATALYVMAVLLMLKREHADLISAVIGALPASPIDADLPPGTPGGIPKSDETPVDEGVVVLIEENARFLTDEQEFEIEEMAKDAGVALPYG